MNNEFGAYLKEWCVREEKQNTARCGLNNDVPNIIASLLLGTYIINRSLYTKHYFI
jgi:hypothetical protein